MLKIKAFIELRAGEVLSLGEARTFRKRIRPAAPIAA
jgi:hypothetical protein